MGNDLYRLHSPETQFPKVSRVLEEELFHLHDDPTCQGQVKLYSWEALCSLP